MISAALLLTAQAATLTVGAGGRHSSVTEALRAAAEGDTVRIGPGIYHEHPVIERRIVLLGTPGATVLDGDGSGVVLTVFAPATIRDLTIRGSGTDQSQEHAGILASNADGLEIVGNRFEDVLFGIYLKECNAAVVIGNDVEGKDLPIPLRGDGIRLWYSHHGVVRGNRVHRSRDVVIWFSDSTLVQDNLVAESRYGLHYMYSNHNVFERNRFTGNHVGAFIMYSSDIVFRDNVFADARGTSGRGLGFKDADDIRAIGNTMVKNAVGISLDDSPSSDRSRNVFERNVLAYNDVGVSLLPSVKGNAFHGNDFVDNLHPVAVTGGGTALANTWSGNHWSDYAGFDADRDGSGDTPFVFERLSDDLLARYETLKVLELSPAAAMLNVLGRVFPLLAPQPVVIDSAPRLARATRSDGPSPAHRARGPAAAVFFTAGALLAMVVPVLGRRQREPS